MPQEKIQAWIERIIAYIKDVIRLEGGNEYKEGRLKGKAKNRVHWLFIGFWEGIFGNN